MLEARRKRLVYGRQELQKKLDELHRKMEAKSNGDT